MTTSAFNRSQITYPAGIQNICDFRLTLVTGTPVMTSSQTGITTLYMTPYKGSEISLYDGTAWQLYSTTERTLSLSGYTASKNYDIWCYNSGGTPTLDSTVWTNDTTRATALTTQNGVLVKNGDATRRYIGTIRINGTGGQCNYVFGSLAANGGAADFGVWNMYNRVNVSTFVGDSTDSWTYSTAAWRAVNNSNTNRASFVIGVSEDGVTARYRESVYSAGSSLWVSTSIALDSTSTPNGTYASVDMQSAHGANLTCEYTNMIAAGYHYLQVLEYGGTSVTTYGDLAGAFTQMGLSFSFLM